MAEESNPRSGAAQASATAATDDAVVRVAELQQRLAEQESIVAQLLVERHAGSGSVGASGGNTGGSGGGISGRDSGTIATVVQHVQQNPLSPLPSASADASSGHSSESGWSQAEHDMVAAALAEAAPQAPPPPMNAHAAAAIAADEQMALALQQSEVAHQAAALERQAQLEEEEAARGGRDGMCDPVWGPLAVTDQPVAQQPGEQIGEPDHAHDDGGDELDEEQQQQRRRRRATPLRILGFACCPCCCTGRSCRTDPELRGALRRAFFSWSCQLAALQTIMLVACLGVGGGFAPRVVNPMLGPWPGALVLLGAKNTALIVYRGQVMRLLGPMLLHAGWVHLGMNVFIQLRLGLYLELRWGWRRWLALYIISGVGSSVLSCIFLPDAIGVGSSGALMGIIGAQLAELWANWGQGTDEEHAMRLQQLVLSVVNVTIVISFSFVPYVDWAAHIGGLIVGMIASFVVLGSEHGHASSDMRAGAVPLVDDEYGAGGGAGAGMRHTPGGQDVGVAPRGPRGSIRTNPKLYWDLPPSPRPPRRWRIVASVVLLLFFFVALLCAFLAVKPDRALLDLCNDPAFASTYAAYDQKCVA